MNTTPEHTPKQIKHVRIPNFEAIRQDHERYWENRRRKWNKFLTWYFILLPLSYLLMFLLGGFKDL